MAEHNEIGKIGENIAISFLMKHGFVILERNFHTRYGELDIVAKKDNMIHFVEVKTVKVRQLDITENRGIQPSDNLTGRKYSRFAISAEGYLKARNVPHGTLWRLDLACVYLDTENRKGRVVLMENIHKE